MYFSVIHLVTNWPYENFMVDLAEKALTFGSTRRTSSQARTGTLRSDGQSAQRTL